VTDSSRVIANPFVGFTIHHVFSRLANVLGALGANIPHLTAGLSSLRTHQPPTEDGTSPAVVSTAPVICSCKHAVSLVVFEWYGHCVFD
jgi:hypothetical protein